jgi:2-methylaconitate cis-trans-isomerase PrpF
VRGWTTVPCSIYRGGTSKALFFRRKDLPSDPVIRERVLLRIFGSPDARQIDGLGGASPTTSKLAIVDRAEATHPAVDVEYTFGQVSITDSQIDFRVNCGNIIAAVGPYAIQQGLLTVRDEPVQIVRIYNTNTQSVVHAHVPVLDGQFNPDGLTKIPGVPGTGSRIQLDFFGVGGGQTGRLLPTGHLYDPIRLPDGREFNVSVIDAGNITVFMDADELGVKGTEVTEDDIRRCGPVLETMEVVRREVGIALGLYKPGERVDASNHAIPKIAYVQRPKSYLSTAKEVVSAEDIDVCARVLTMGRLHPAYAVTGAIALAVAAELPGTVVHQKVLRNMSMGGGQRNNSIDHEPRSGWIRIGHPSGVMPVNVELTQGSSGDWEVRRVSLIRTARPLMDGFAWVPTALLS